MRHQHKNVTRTFTIWAWAVDGERLVTEEIGGQRAYNARIKTLKADPRIQSMRLFNHQTQKGVDWVRPFK